MVLFVLWAALWVVGFGFAIVADGVDRSGDTDHKIGPVVYGVLWVVSTLTSLGTIPPKDEPNSLIFSAMRATRSNRSGAAPVHRRVMCVRGAVADTSRSACRSTRR